MRAPTNVKELCSSLGRVMYYRDMWPYCSHILAPLTALVKSKKFQWGPEQQKAFDEMRFLMVTDCVLVFPDHNKPFMVESDASNYQLGAVIKQEGRAVAYYFCKLTLVQKNYTTIEKELLSVIEMLHTFCTMLLGAKIVVKTDHKNLTYKLSLFTTQHVMCWRLLLEEFSPIFEYKKGMEIVIADVLSCLPTLEEKVTLAMPEMQCIKVNDLWTECLWAMPWFDEPKSHKKVFGQYQSLMNRTIILSNFEQLIFISSIQQMSKICQDKHLTCFLMCSWEKQMLCAKCKERRKG